MIDSITSASSHISRCKTKPLIKSGSFLKASDTDELFNPALGSVYINQVSIPTFSQVSAKALRLQLIGG